MAAPIGRFSTQLSKYNVINKLPLFGPKIHPISTTQITTKRWCYEARDVDLSTAKQNIFMFDTHAVVKKLEQRGFSLEQAEAVTNTISELSISSMNHQNKHMVTKAQQEIMLQQILAHIGSVKKDMIILEKSEFSALKHEYEKQHIEITQLKQSLQDEITKLKSGLSLDLSLERAKSSEAHRANEKLLEKCASRIDIQQSEGEKERGKLDNKIDREIANLLATYERYRNDVIKYAAGAIGTCLTITLGFYRIWMA